MTEKKRGFWKALGIYALALLLLSAAGLAVFWFFMSSYEKSRPEKTVEEYISVQSEDFWRDGVREAIRSGGEFELRSGEPETYGVDMPEGFALSYRREKSPDESSESYVLSVRGADISRLTLKKSRSAGFGLYTWAVAKCQFLAGNARNLTIVAPDYAVVTINGVTVSRDYVTASEESFDCELTHPFDVKPGSVTYTVEDLHGPLEAKADDGAGAELSAGEPVGGVITFLPAAVWSFRCCAPEGANVLVNGAPLPAEYEDGQTAAMMEELSGYMDGGADFYSCSGLMSAPKLSAFGANGEELTPIPMDDGSVSFVPGSAALLPVELTPMVEGFIRAYVAFSANLDDDIEKNYERLGWYLLSGTDLSRRIYNTQEALYWVGGASVRYNSLDIHDYIPLGNNCFACLVDYEIVNRTGYEDRQVSAHCTVIFVRSGGWLAAGMAVE